MMRRLLLSLVCACSASPALASDVVSANGFDAVWVAGYHVGYQHDLYPTAHIDFAALSHIVIGPVLPHADGSVGTAFDIDDVNGPIWARGVATAAHAASRKALLMIGGAGAIDGWRGAASNANRAAFVTNLLATMDDIGSDGLDLDWEPLDAGDEPNFLALAQALRSARPNMLMTVPVNWININLDSTPNPFFGQIAPYFDRIDVMTYDMEYDQFGWDSWFTSALTGESGSTPSSVDASVSFYLRSGVPRSKLGIGIGFYGVCWKVVTGPRQTIPAGGGVVGSDNTYSYRNVVTQYYAPSRYHFDAVAQSAWLGGGGAFGPGACTYLSYEDATAVAAKGAYARRNGLGGTIIWTIGEGYVPEQVGQENALLNAVDAAFGPTH